VQRHSYAKCRCLAGTLRAAHDAVLRDHDLLLMPTLPLKATPITAPASPRMQIIQREGPRS
jgi:amidase